MRWLVERSPDVFDDLDADSMNVHASGALEFYDGSVFSPKNRLYIASGSWITVLQEDES